MPRSEFSTGNPLLDEMSPEQIRELYNRAVADEASAHQSERENEAAMTFLQARPEYIPNKKNGAVLQAVIEETGVKVSHWTDIDRVYQRLAARGAIERNQEVLQELQRQDRQAEIDAYRNRPKTNGYESYHSAAERNQQLEDAAWTMDLDELRQKALEEERRQQGQNEGYTPNW